MKKKKVLITYASFGKGHVSATNATKEALELLYGDQIEVEPLDFFKFTAEFLDKTVQKSYESSTKFFPKIYKFLFELSDQQWTLKFLNAIVYPAIYSAMKKIVNEKNPDIIVSTFPIWDLAIASIWKKKNPNAKFINIITDSISIHQAWMVCDADYRVVANEDTAKVLMKSGIPENEIKILGFPVALEFSKDIDRETVLKSLNLNPKLFTILLFATTGKDERNLKIFEEVISEKRDYNVICIMGRNKTLFEKIHHFKNEKNVAILDWVINVPELMKTSDLIITKSGGATVMECIAAEKPMIITQVIPGQEEGNRELITRHNLGIIMEKGQKGIDNIQNYISKIRKDYNKFKLELQKQSKPKAALKIAQLIASELGIKD
ncbi:glycosyltransferase [Patescibacteria group bacterium]|nr:glycosyltransferase [Patescibacteria group bacterium]